MTAQVLAHIEAVTNTMVRRYREEQENYHRGQIAHFEANFPVQEQKKIEYHKDVLETGNIQSVKFEVSEGKKYYKIILITSGNSRSVHAFVDKNTGEMYKAASWDKPAKHVRLRLLDPESLAQCLHRCDWAGGYLYM